MGGSAPTETSKFPSPLAMRMEVLVKKPEAFDALQKRVNQHRLVRASVFNLALISLSALAFFVAQLGSRLRLFIVLLLLSILFVGLALFTGRRSAETLYFELSQAHKALNEAAPNATGAGDEQSANQGASGESG